MLERLAQLARTTAFRIIALYVALFVAAAGVAAAIVLSRANADLSESVVRGLVEERDALAGIAASRGLPELATVVAERSRLGPRGLYRVEDAAGRALAGNLTRLPPELAGTGGSAAVFRYAAGGLLGGEDRLAVGVTVALPDGARLVVARDIEDQRALVQRLRQTFLWGLGLLALAGLVGGVLASRIMLGRVETVNRTAQSIMAGDLSKRIPLEGSGDEIDELARNLNGMLERIEELMAGLRQVSDNIAHDLKTPLTRLRSRAEAALRDERGETAQREGLERTIEDADDLIKTFNAMLLVARLEAGAVEDSDVAFDLADVVADVAELYEPVAEEAGLSLSVAISARPLIRANREMIGQALANLLDNAIKYSAGVTPAGLEQVAIALDASEAGVEMTVRDHGPGIAPEDRARALKRFVRLEASRTRPGTGLGLSLVAAVARLHGGSVRLADNAPGLVVSLLVPSSRVVERQDAIEIEKHVAKAGNAG